METEVLVNKLENEIVEWNPSNKLSKRDRELEKIGNMINASMSELKDEIKKMEEELGKIIDALESGDTHNEDYLRNVGEEVK